MKNLLFGGILFLSILSCRTDDGKIEGDLNAMQKITLQSQNARSEEKGNIHSRKKPTAGSVNIFIFEVTIGRSSQGCLKGWGFCNFQWFPSFQNSATTGNKKQVEVWEYADGTFDLEIYSDGVVQNPKDPTLDLIVETDLIDTTNQGRKFTVKAGTYHFDSSLGAYGGYNIPVFEL